MTIKEIHAKAGGISSYVGYILLLFCWYFLDNRLTSIQTDLPENSLLTLIEWANRLVIAPLVLAGVFGGIYLQQSSQDDWDTGAIWRAIKTYAWRFLRANLVSLVIYATVTVVFLTAQGVDPANIDSNKLLMAAVAIPFSAMNLFWFTAIVVEGKIFRGLLRAFGTLLLRPFALTIGFLWGVIAFADSFGIDFPAGGLALPMDALRAGVLAVARVGAIMYAIAIYVKARGQVAEATGEKPNLEPTDPGEGVIKASFGFSFVSFLPVFHLVALILGIIALQRRKKFVLKAAVACCLGGFFTIYYAFMLLGWLVSRSTPSTAPGYVFLAEVNRDVRPQVVLLQQGSFQEVRGQLEQTPSNLLERHWTLDTASALAKLGAHDPAAALEDFRLAAKKNPERSEFYYYYGVALLQDGQQKSAAEQFQAALSHEPHLEGAERYVNLLQSTYTPSPLLSGLLYVFVLLILFTFHEYGHAFAAWKLGDDTAAKQGRLTLNPIPHLDLFGSIILPAILLFQQSQLVFGWARPVPVDPRNFKNPRGDHMLVSFAGPGMNLGITMLSLILLSGMMLVLRLLWPETMTLNLSSPFSSISLVGPPLSRWLILLVVFLKQLFYTSLVLGCFNLLPIPPLDGSWIFSGWLPQGLRNIYEKTRQFGFVIFILLVATSVFDYILIVPITLSWGALQLLVSAMGLG